MTVRVMKEQHDGEFKQVSEVSKDTAIICLKQEGYEPTFHAWGDSIEIIYVHSITGEVAVLEEV